MYQLKIELKSQWEDCVIEKKEKQYQMNPNKIEAYRDTQTRNTFFSTNTISFFFSLKI